MITFFLTTTISRALARALKGACLNSNSSIYSDELGVIKVYDDLEINLAEKKLYNKEKTAPIIKPSTKAQIKPITLPEILML